MTDRLGAPGSYFFTCLLSKLKSYETFESLFLGNHLIFKDTSYYEMFLFFAFL